MEFVLLLIVGGAVAGCLEARKMQSARLQENAAAGVVASYLDWRLTRTELLVGSDNDTCLRYPISGLRAELEIFATTLLDARRGAKKSGEREGVLVMTGDTVTLSRVVDDTRCTKAKRFETTFNELAAAVLQPD